MFCYDIPFTHHSVKCISWLPQDIVSFLVSDCLPQNSHVLSAELFCSCFSCLHLITLGSDERASIFVFEMRGFKRHLSGTAFPKKAAVWLEHCACELHSWPLNTTLASATLVISTLLMLPGFSWLFFWWLDTHDKTQRSSSLDRPLSLPILS